LAEGLREIFDVIQIPFGAQSNFLLFVILSFRFVFGPERSGR
jgi:hypothetical protein